MTSRNHWGGQGLHNLTMEEETSYSMFKCPVNTEVPAMTPECLLHLIATYFHTAYPVNLYATKAQH